MFRKNRRFGLKGRLFDFGLAAVVIAVVVMMVVPLTPWLLDLLISLNLGVSILVLTLALFIRRPLSFAAFPTLLLIATLYRLALNVSSTRLILLHADAGKIIGGFGGFVVGGDILVGAVIFGILAMVLFLVITKGAERVAEVAARFTLDALPGMQLAIDSDVRSGAISAMEASKQRSELDRRSRYYGALDGAMKFVRGDAIAGLVIIAVNIVGGIAVGTLRHGLSIGEALSTYGRLTVGDGLVTMIPALLVSTAAGLLVTRVGQGSEPGRLGAQLGHQLVSEPRALGVAAVLMVVLAIIPEFPAWPFILIGAIFAITSVVQLRHEVRTARTKDEKADLFEEPSSEEARAVLEIGDALYEELIPLTKDWGGLSGVSRRLAFPLQSELGLPIATVPIIKMTHEIDGREARLRIRNLVVSHIVLPPSATADDTAGSLSRVVRWIEPVLQSRAGQLVDMDLTQALVDKVAKTRPVLVRETVPKLIGLPDLSRLLAWLVIEGISLDYLGDVLEVLSTVEVGKNPEELLKQVRCGLSAVITAHLLDGKDSFCAVVLDTDVESVLMTSLTTTSRGKKLALSSDAQSEVIGACEKATANIQTPVLLVNSELRGPLSTMLNGHLQGVSVIAHGEIEPHVSVDVVGKVEI
jgi:flagellar biosynthesis component FlhA